jgi:hypothetical protein
MFDAQIDSYCEGWLYQPEEGIITKMLKINRQKQQFHALTSVFPFLLCGLLTSPSLLILSSPAGAQSSPKAPLPPSTTQYKTPLSNPLAGFILTDNTPVKLRFKETISSKTAQENQPIEFEVVDDVVVQGLTVIARGTSAKGIISEIKKARMLGRKGKITIVLKEVPLVSGERVSLRSNQTQGGGLSAGTIALSAIVTPFFLFMGGKEAKYTAGTEFSAFVDGDFALNRSKFVQK